MKTQNKYQLLKPCTKAKEKSGQKYSSLQSSLSIDSIKGMQVFAI